jgi:uncharacterized membrane protein
VACALVGAAAFGATFCKSDGPSSPNGSPQGTVTGAVLSSSTGAPIAGATVQSGTATTTTDANGQFTLTADAGERVLVRLRAAGFAATLRALRLRSSQSTDLQVQLIPVGASQSLTVATMCT